MSVGAVVMMRRLVEGPKAWVLTNVSTEPPLTTLDAMLAKVSVASAAPALFSVMVLPPQVEVRAPNCRAEAAVPFATKVKLPFAKVIVRAVPPMRVSTPAVSSTFNRALLLMTMLPVALDSRPAAPEMFIVPWLIFQAPEAEAVMFAVTFNVPVPTLVGLAELLMSPFTLMIPVPTALKVMLLPRARLPMFNVAPLAAPKVMPAELVFVTAPTVPMLFTPLAENTPPVLLMPLALKAPTVMSMGFTTVTPLVR